MNNTIRVKTILLLMLLTNGAYAEEIYNLFLFDKGKSDETHIQTSESDSIVLGVYNTDIRALSLQSKIRVNIDGRDIIFTVENMKKKSNERVSFSARSDNKGTMHIAESHGSVVGSLHHLGKLYKIRPDKQGNTVLIEVPQERLIDHDASYYENPQVNISNDTDNSSTFSDTGDEITVIVTFTSEFAAAAGNTTAYMDLLEQETNTAFDNSNVNTSVTIVHAYQTSYDESGSFYTDRTYFSDDSNPETQELYQLRDQFHADIMMVLTGNSYGFCGIARTIGATEDQALALARESCATGYYSFGHEIGHLFGARHIISQDSNTTPFEYGHGYCNTTANTWRTVMAYNCPSGTGGPRIQQWSNPNVAINGDPTGTVDIEFNAQVMNVRAQTVANFRSSPQDLSWLIPVVNLILF